MEGSWSRSAYIPGYTSLRSSLLHKKPFEFLIQLKLCMEDSCVRKWTILTDPAQGKSAFLLLTLLTIQRVGKDFAGICAVCFLFCFKSFVALFISIQGNITCSYFLSSAFLISMLSTLFSKHTVKILSRIGFMTQNRPLQATLDTSS